MDPPKPIDPSGDLLRRLLDGARQLGQPIEENQASQLLAYLASLQRWNAVHSLSAWRTPSDFLVHHVFDGLALVGPLTRLAKGKPLQVLDAGSGAGFPAVVLAAMRPQWVVTAVDAVAKKVAFIRQAAADAAISNLTAVHSRLEEFSPAARFDVIVSRAFSSLDHLAAVTRHLLSPDGVWVAQKGRVPEAEMAALGHEQRVFHVEPVTVPELEARRHLVWMRKSQS